MSPNFFDDECNDVIHSLSKFRQDLKKKYGTGYSYEKESSHLSTPRASLEVDKQTSNLSLCDYMFLREIEGILCNLLENKVICKISYASSSEERVGKLSPIPLANPASVERVERTIAENNILDNYSRSGSRVAPTTCQNYSDPESVQDKYPNHINAFPTSAGSTTSSTGYGDSIKRTRHQTPHGPAEKSAENVISFTPINASSRLVCPFKDCHRNTCVPKRTFARADNLGSHLRNVHGLRVPARARVRKWIGLTNLQSAASNNLDGEKMRQLFATVSGSTLGGSN